MAFLSEALVINKALSELIIESKHNYIRSISDITQISAQPTDTYLECEGAASLSQALGKNEALTKLSLAGEAKKKHNCDICLSRSILLCFEQTGNGIGSMGMKALCETLKTNGAITEIDLRCKHKHEHHLKYTFITLFFSFTIHS